MRQQHLDELERIRKENGASLKNEMSEFRSKEREISRLQQELSALRRNHDRLAGEKARVEEDLQRHQAAESLAKRTPKKLPPAMGTYDPAVSGPDKSVPRARTPGRADAGELRRLRAKSGDQARDIKRLNARVQELEAQLEKARTQAATASGSSGGSGGSPAGSVEELKRKLRNLSNQARRDKDQMKTLQADNFKMKSKHDTLSQELQRTRQQLQKAESSARALRAKSAQRAKPSAAAAAAASAEDRKLERRIAELERLVNERTEQVDNLRKAKTKADGECKRLASRLDAAENKAKQAEASSTQATKQLESMKTVAESSAARRAETTELKAVIKAHESTIKQLNKEVLVAQQQYAQLARHDPVSAAALADLQARYDALQSTVEAGTDVADLAASNAALKGRVQRLEEEAAAAAQGRRDSDALQQRVDELTVRKMRLVVAVVVGWLVGEAKGKGGGRRKAKRMFGCCFNWCARCLVACCASCLV